MCVSVQVEKCRGVVIEGSNVLPERGGVGRPHDATEVLEVTSSAERAKPGLNGPDTHPLRLVSRLNA